MLALLIASSTIPKHRCINDPVSCSLPPSAVGKRLRRAIALCRDSLLRTAFEAWAQASGSVEHLAQFASCSEPSGAMLNGAQLYQVKVNGKEATRF